MLPDWVSNPGPLTYESSVLPIALRGRAIGVGRFRILGGGKVGANSQQAHDVVLTSMRRNDVTSTSF